MDDPKHIYELTRLPDLAQADPTLKKLIPVDVLDADGEPAGTYYVTPEDIGNMAITTALLTALGNLAFTYPDDGTGKISVTFNGSPIGHINVIY
jgi:hypothetical protein